MARSDAELGIAAGHLNYELGALVACYRRLLKAENERDMAGANAFLEAMLVHARCLIEFIAKPRRESDIHRHDYLPGWEPSALEGDEVRRLFEEISKHLSHLSWKRAEVLTDESPTWPYRIPFVLVTVFEAFLAELRKEHQGKSWFTLIETGVQGGRRELPVSPPSGGATTTSEPILTTTTFLKREGPPRDHPPRCG